MDTLHCTVTGVGQKLTGQKLTGLKLTGQKLTDKVYLRYYLNFRERTSAKTEKRVTDRVVAQLLLTVQRSATIH